ncbi:MAG TPA: ChaN family lipoprotein [Gemmatimonadales bacterium]|nr:ChaN family lipoprotein [Gemmatimonadales bacterium]
MHTPLRLAPLLLLVACGQKTPGGTSPAQLPLPDSVTIVDARTGAAISGSELLHRAASADFVLLGEIHDNPAHHQVRGAMLTALAARQPGVVFEQLARNPGPIPPPAAGEAEETWLDAHGFDRKGWKWPLHQPVVDAAIAHAGSLWGSNVPREALRSVVRQGTGAAPPELGALITRVPLDSAAQAGIDQELFEGHCGKLPQEMVPGMRAAQEVRDAAMTDALLAAGTRGPAWLIAGDGHVRMDMGVPRILGKVAPGKSMLVVGFVERGSDDATPGATAARRYQVLVITPAAQREDPCAGL